jgi:hypothetical protein
MAIFLSIATFLATSSFAVTLVISKTEEGEIQQMWIEDSKMRVDMSEQTSYLLIDTKDKKMYAVDTAHKSVMDMSSSLNRKAGENAAKEKYKVTYESRGKGPEIAGYATRHYEFFVNGNKCSDEYLSEKAMSHMKADDFFESMSNLGAMEMEGMPPEMIEPCMAAHAKSGEIYKKEGIPLKIVEADGATEYEVLKIDKNASLPEGGFDMPPGYPVQSLDAMLQESMKRMPQTGNMPENVDPKELQKMMEEMMKQMGKQ